MDIDMQLIHFRPLDFYRGGIGKATALLLAKSGCNIALHYNSDAQQASDIVDEIRALGVKADAFKANLISNDEIRTMHSEVVQKMGNPDILYNNAGTTNKIIGFQGSIQDISVEAFEETWRININSHFLVSGYPLNRHSTLIF